MKYFKTLEIIEKLFLNKLNPTVIIRHELLSKTRTITSDNEN